MSELRSPGREVSTAAEGTEASARQAVESALAELGLSFESPRPGAYLVRLDGEHKQATMTWLIVAAHSLHVEAFFCLLGCVLSYSDENFDPALTLGFASSIRREWAWRVKRGVSLANLQAFATLADRPE